MARKSVKDIRKKIKFNKFMRYRREWYTLAECTSRYIKMKLEQPSFMDIVTGFADKYDNVYHRSLCGKTLTVCTNYDCMPHHLRLQERTKRQLTYKGRRRKENDDFQKFLDGLSTHYKEVIESDKNRTA